MTWEIIKYVDDVSDEALLECIQESEVARDYILKRWPHIKFAYMKATERGKTARFITLSIYVDSKDVERIIIENPTYEVLRTACCCFGNSINIVISERAILHVIRNSPDHHPTKIINLLEMYGFSTDFIKGAIATHLEILPNKIWAIMEIDHSVYDKYLTEHMVSYAITHRNGMMAEVNMKRLLRKHGFSKDLYWKYIKSFTWKDILTKIICNI